MNSEWLGKHRRKGGTSKPATTGPAEEQTTMSINVVVVCYWLDF